MNEMKDSKTKESFVQKTKRIYEENKKAIWTGVFIVGGVCVSVIGYNHFQKYINTIPVSSISSISNIDNKNKLTSSVINGRQDAANKVPAFKTVMSVDNMNSQICDFSEIAANKEITRSYTNPINPVTVSSHLRNLGNNRYPSAAKISEAESLGIILQPNQTIVDSFTKYSANSVENFIDIA